MDPWSSSGRVVLSCRWWRSLQVFSLRRFRFFKSAVDVETFIKDSITKSDDSSSLVFTSQHKLYISAQWDVPFKPSHVRARASFLLNGLFCTGLSCRSFYPRLIWASLSDYPVIWSRCPVAGSIGHSQVAWLWTGSGIIFSNGPAQPSQLAFTFITLYLLYCYIVATLLLFLRLKLSTWASSIIYTLTDRIS